MKISVKCYVIAICALFAGMVHADSQTKTAHQVFGKWLSWQMVFPDLQVSSFHALLNQDFIVAHNKVIAENNDAFKPILPLLNHVQDQKPLRSDTPRLLAELTNSCKENLIHLYSGLENDIGYYLETIKSFGFCNDHNSELDNRLNSTPIIQTHTKFLESLFAHERTEVSFAFMFNVANNMFEYAFDNGWEHTYDMFKNPEQYPALRSLYADIWYSLCGTGWRHWHEQCLTNVACDAQNGKRVVYIAGGSDIYQLIGEYGIYNLTVVDPQLPTQPTYYTNEWEFLIKGDGPDNGIGDTIQFEGHPRGLFMKRIGFVLGEPFQATLADNSVATLHKSVTTWGIYDKNHTFLGSYIVDRRFADQSDFDCSPNRSLLISFNELYFITLPEVLGGWNIEISRFDPSITIHVKQLRKPVGKRAMDNMLKASWLNAADLNFIALGTCVT